MNYFKGIENGYIGAIGTGEIVANGVMNAEIISIGMWAEISEITEAEYNEILSVVKTKPHTEGKGYRLKNDLTWEEYAVEPVGDEDLTDGETLSVIMGDEL